MEFIFFGVDFLILLLVWHGFFHTHGWRNIHGVERIIVTIAALSIQSFDLVWRDVSLLLARGNQYTIHINLYEKKN